jgi:membrane peptidoglycan carboxypeptidase
MPNYLPNIYQLKKQASNNSLYNFALTIFTFFTISAVIVSSLSFVGSWISYQWELAPDSEKILSAKSSESTKILASDGSLLFEMYDKENREIVDEMETSTNKPTNKNYIPLSMQYSILALEDQNFYFNESGVPFSNIVGAGIECLTSAGNNCRGASGIYQQLVKNKTLNDEQTIDRKIQEIISSYKLGISEDVTHDQVLNLYLNTVGFGLNAHGVQKAAKVYFKKDIKDITLAQACFLAGLPQIPPNRNTDLSDPNSSDFSYYLNRKNICLENLTDSKKILKPNQKPFITPEQFEIYKNEEIKITPEDQMKRYPHFVDYVIQEIAYKFLTSKGDKIAFKNINEDENSEVTEKESAQYGTLVYDRTIKELKTGGYVIQTSLDPNIQGKLERNLENARYANVGANNAAGVVLDGPTGGIVGMVGSRDFNNRDIAGQINQIGTFSPFDKGFSAWHTVGSTFKIYDYSMALNAGINPNTYLSNAPFKFGGRSNNLTNFIKDFARTETVSRSLPQSYNVGAAKAAYIGAVGLNPNFASYEDNSKTVAGLREWTQKMGVSYQRTDEQIDKVTSSSPMAIGAEDVSLLSHATGANTLAQQGNLRTATPFVSIKYQDRDLYKEKMALGDKAPYKVKDNIMDKGVANQMSNMLSMRSGNSLLRGRPVTDGWDFAVKTGTATRDYNGREQEVELSAIGWSPKYTTLVWMGRTINDKTGWGPLYGGAESSPNLANPVFVPLMNELHEGKEGQKFTNDGLSEFRGMLLTDKQKSVYSQVRSVY